MNNINCPICSQNLYRENDPFTAFKMCKCGAHIQLNPNGSFNQLNIPIANKVIITLLYDDKKIQIWKSKDYRTFTLNHTVDYESNDQFNKLIQKYNLFT